MKAVVLSSGGLDSTTCLALAVKNHGAENVVTVSLFYGQRHSKELECANKVAKHYGVKHFEKDISTVMEFSNCSLLSHSTEKVQEGAYADQIKENDQGRVTTYVPYRNGLLLSIAAAIADSLFPGEEVKIYYGAHADDAAGNAYADCSPEFVESISKTINIGTYGNISVEAPFINLNKAGVVKAGLELNVPYELTWSCYNGGEKACGKCGTCIDRLEAFRANGVTDPIKYE